MHELQIYTVRVSQSPLFHLCFAPPPHVQFVEVMVPVLSDGWSQLRWTVGLTKLLTHTWYSMVQYCIMLMNVIARLLKNKLRCFFCNLNEAWNSLSLENASEKWSCTGTSPYFSVRLCIVVASVLHGLFRNAHLKQLRVSLSDRVSHCAS